MYTNTFGSKGAVENLRTCDDQKRLRGGVERGLLREVESGIDDVKEDVKNDHVVSVPSLAVLQRQQQQQLFQGPVIRWERFLPLNSLKVLLVESDYSTRQIVSALLRKCSYEVMAVGNGQEAWKALEDLTNHIDLVLTEVVMPDLSGVGLLCKIMSHKSCKNIPVIMMSPNDSLSLVIKCLSQGASDFLAKPIRKNQLKNLWLHVWRKCRSSGGSGSESGIRTQKSSSSNCEELDSNSGSNGQDNDIERIGTHVKDGSDNGSGTQNSWTKKAVEAGSPKPPSPRNKSAEAESPKPWSPRNRSAYPPDSTCARVNLLSPVSFPMPLSATREFQGCESHDDKIHELGSKNDGRFQNEWMEINSGQQSGELSDQTADLMGIIANNAHSQRTHAVKDKSVHDAIEIPLLELSLKRPRDIGDARTSDNDRNVLMRSDISAFSRYNTDPAANEAPTGNVGSCSPVDNSTEAIKTEANASPTNQHCSKSSSSKKNGMTSTSSYAFLEPSASAPDETDLAQPNAIDQQVRVMHLHHHYHHHHHHVHDIEQKERLSDLNDLDVKEMEPNAPQCGISDVLDMAVDGDSGDRSNSGGTEKGKGGDGSGGSGSGLDQIRCAHREAALDKFRRKRKERCFEKKVRYQNRKIRAEQRPRVRGQFVRGNVVRENTSDEACS